MIGGSTTAICYLTQKLVRVVPLPTYDAERLRARIGKRVAATDRMPARSECYSHPITPQSFQSRHGSAGHPQPIQSRR